MPHTVLSTSIFSLWNVRFQRMKRLSCHPSSTDLCPTFPSTQRQQTHIVPSNYFTHNASALCLYCNVCVRVRAVNEAGFMQAWVSCEWHTDESRAVNHSDCFRSVVHYQKETLKGLCVRRSRGSELLHRLGIGAPNQAPQTLEGNPWISLEDRSEGL